MHFRVESAVESASLKRNAIANYVGQAYASIVSITVLPIYLQFLGAEAYGLVGLFALMQAWMQLLDIGLTPTLGRQFAYARGKKREFEEFKRLLKSFELIFAGLSIVVVSSIIISGSWIVSSWIQANNIEQETILYCVNLMGIMIGMRWFTGLYRSGINGMERQVWLNAANMLIVSVKFIGSLILLSVFTQEISHFFEYQLVVSIIELVIIAIYFYSKLPKTDEFIPIVYFDISAVKNVAPFAFAIAYSSGVWVVVTQTDKLILSGVLTLSDYGYFSLVALVAGSIVMISSPIYKAIIPRMTYLYSQGNKDEMVYVYRISSQIATLIGFSFAIMVGFYAEPLIYAWTGNIKASSWGKEVLVWFALGNGVLTIAAFQYYLQSAIGQLRLHVIGSSISALVQVPIIFYAATHYGAIGAGIAWFCFRLIWFLWWSPIIHRKYLPGFHLKWLMHDILPIILCIFLVLLVFREFIHLNLDADRFLLVVQLIVMGVIMLLSGSLVIKAVRVKVVRLVRGVLCVN